MYFSQAWAALMEDEAAQLGRTREYSVFHDLMRHEAALRADVWSEEDAIFMDLVFDRVQGARRVGRKFRPQRLLSPRSSESSGSAHTSAAVSLSITPESGGGPQHFTAYSPPDTGAVRRRLTLELAQAQVAELREIHGDPASLEPESTASAP